METTEKRPILVTWDFTEKSEFALAHGTSLADILGTYVGLIHIVKKEKEIAEGEKKLSVVIEETMQKTKVEIKPFVVEGTIFTTISEMASDINAEMVIMGTHGRSGVSRWAFGSVADRVIRNSTVPVLLACPKEFRGGK